MDCLERGGSLDNAMYHLLLSLLAANPLHEQLLQMETQIYTAWQNRSASAIESNLASDALAWGEYGIFDKATQIDLQKRANAACKVASFRLRDVRLLEATPDSAILIYTVDQDAECGGAKVPTPISNSTLYVRRSVVWKVLFRANVTPKN